MEMPTENKKHWYLYVLLCENNKYYIGITLDLTKRITKQFKQSSTSSVFCKKHKPENILYKESIGLATRPNAELLESIVACDYVDKYGFDNVGGGGLISTGNENKYIYNFTRYQEACLFIKHAYIKDCNKFIELTTSKKFKVYPLGDYLGHRININKKQYRLGERIDDIPIDIKTLINKFHNK